MSETDKTLVSIATYNELENLPRLIDEIFHHAPQVDILIVDDNSPDGTGRWCDELATRDHRVHCLHRQGKLGQGSAVVAAMRYAIENDYTHLVNLDADFSHPPHILPEILAGMDDGADVTIGSRYVPGGGTKNWPLHRWLMSRCVNIYARWLLGLKVKDCSGAYRGYRVAMLKRLDLDDIRSQGYAFQEEVLWRLQRQGARFAETPILFTERQQGSSKINLHEVITAVWIIFRLGLYHWLLDWRKST